MAMTISLFMYEYEYLISILQYDEYAVFLLVMYVSYALKMKYIFYILVGASQLVDREIGFG